MMLRDIQNLKARITKKSTSGLKDTENNLAFFTYLILKITVSVAVDENDYLRVVYYQVIYIYSSH